MPIFIQENNLEVGENFDQPTLEIDQTEPINGS